MRADHPRVESKIIETIRAEHPFSMRETARTAVNIEKEQAEHLQNKSVCEELFLPGGGTVFQL